MKAKKQWVIISAIVLCVMVAPARANWRPATAEVTEAAKNPLVADVLAVVDRVDTAVVTGDKATFVGVLAPDVVVNSPGNAVVRREAIVSFFDRGRINYSSFERVIEYAAPRGTAEVVLMGEEVYVPRDTANHAGKTIHRRFTYVWHLDNGHWLLVIRQATIRSVD